MYYIILFLISINVHAHGSSHPRWSINRSTNGTEYVSCNGFDVSTESSLAVTTYRYEKVSHGEHWWNGWHWITVNGGVYNRQMDQFVSPDRMKLFISRVGQECYFYKGGQLR